MEKKYSLLKFFTSGAYINFPYYPLKDYEEEYFGKNAGWLQTVKEKYDPSNFFTFPQAIRENISCPYSP